MYKRKATEFGQFCCSEPRNSANWLVEFGKIFCRKLWANALFVKGYFTYQ